MIPYILERAKRDVVTADIHALINGRHVSIEVKCELDRMRPGQHKTKEAIESSGGIYYIAQNLEDFVRWFQELLSLGSNGN